MIPATLTRAYAGTKVFTQEWTPIGHLPVSGRQRRLGGRRVYAPSRHGEVFKPLETVSLKTMAAFLDSVAAGTLLIDEAEAASWWVLTQLRRFRQGSQGRRRQVQLHLTQIVQASEVKPLRPTCPPKFHDPRQGFVPGPRPS